MLVGQRVIFWPVVGVSPPVMLHPSRGVRSCEAALDHKNTENVPIGEPVGVAIEGRVGDPGGFGVPAILLHPI